MIWLTTWLLGLLFGDVNERTHPLWLRRAYVILFPISFPFVLCLAVVVMIGAMVEALVRSIFSTLVRVWKGD